MAPISARTTLSMSSAVLWGRSDIARSTASRWAVTCKPCRRRRTASSTDDSMDIAVVLPRSWTPSKFGSSTAAGAPCGARTPPSVTRSSAGLRQPNLSTSRGGPESTRRRSERLKRPGDVGADQLADGGFGEPERFAVGAQRKLLEEDPVDHLVDVAIGPDFADIDGLLEDRPPEVPFDTPEPFVDHDLGDPRGRLAAGDDGPEVRMLEHGQNSEASGLDDAIEPLSSGDLLPEGGEQVGRLADDDLEDHLLLRAEVRVDR